MGVFSSPLSYNPKRPGDVLNGSQLGIQLNVTRFQRGFGGFLGGGEQSSAGFARGPMTTDEYGISRSTSDTWELDGGLGDALGVTVQGEAGPDGKLNSAAGGLGGKAGLGGGGYMGSGKQKSWTVVVGPFRCK